MDINKILFMWGTEQVCWINFSQVVKQEDIISFVLPNNNN